MSTTEIEWADVVWNPTTGCDRVSPGCDHCYALTMARRLKAMGQPKYQRDGDPRTSGPGFALTVHPDAVNLPLRWRKPRRVFVNSMSDLLHADVPTPWLADVWAVMAAAQQHTFQVLTKRHGRMKAVLNDESFVAAVFDRALGKGIGRAEWTWPLPNVWLGVSAEDQQRADLRIPALLETPAAVRWVSAEPLLGPIDLGGSVLRPYERQQGGFWEYGHGEDVYGNGRKWVPAPPAQLGWVVVGCESGPRARPMHLDWARQTVDQCTAAGVPVLVKQLPTGPRGRATQELATFPPELQIRLYPTMAGGRG